MKNLFRYLADHRMGIVFFLLCLLVFAAVFWMYGLPLEAVAYPAALCAGAGLLFIAVDFLRQRERHRTLRNLHSLPDDLVGQLSSFETWADQDYRELIACLQEQHSAVQQSNTRKLEDMEDYYTTWVHQIKTPIAAMRLKLQQEDSALSRSLTDDLFRIEQYVSMVLCYLRLNSDFSDFVFQEYPLDHIIKGAVRKFANQFIGRGIRLDYSETGRTVLTDEKWLSFVVEQLLSNALKYTVSGSISIYVEEPLILCIRDTGIGIAPEDLPRIFDRGYTGFNGRLDHKASGLGLYLCKRICGNLGVTISVQSVVGEGTTVRLNLARETLLAE